MFVTILIFNNITLTHVVIVWARANAMNKCNNTFGDAVEMMIAKHFMFTKDKAGIKRIALLAIFQRIIQCTQLSLDNILVKDSFAGVMVADRT